VRCVEAQLQGRRRAGPARLGPVRYVPYAVALLLMACSAGAGHRALAKPGAAPLGGGISSTGRIAIDLWDGQHIGLPVEVNGVATGALLDSGSERTVLDSGFAKQVGVRAAGEALATGIAGSEMGQVASEVQITIGSLRLEGLTTQVLDLSGLEKYAWHPLSVVLGEDVFRRAIVDIDPADDTIAFHAPSSFQAPAGATRLALGRAGGLRVVDVGIEDGPLIPLVFDLGSGVPVTLAPAYWRKHLDLRSRPTSTSLAAGVGGTKESVTCTLSPVQLAGVLLASVPAALESEPAAEVNAGALGTLGFPVLRRFHLFVDDAHNCLYLVPDPGAIARPFAKDRLGLSLVREGGFLRVVHVGRGSPAAAAGFRAGDRIAALDGRPAGTWTRRDLGALAERPAGTAVSIRSSDGTARSVVLQDFS